MAGCNSSFGSNDYDRHPMGEDGAAFLANLRTRAAAMMTDLVEAVLWMRGQEVPGAISRYSSATGTASSSATATG